MNDEIKRQYQQEITLTRGKKIKKKVRVYLNKSLTRTDQIILPERRSSICRTI